MKKTLKFLRSVKNEKKKFKKIKTLKNKFLTTKNVLQIKNSFLNLSTIDSTPKKVFSISCDLQLFTYEFTIGLFSFSLTLHLSTNFF
jgi:hypothetical protein